MNKVIDQPLIDLAESPSEQSYFYVLPQIMSHLAAPLHWDRVLEGIQTYIQIFHLNEGLMIMAPISLVV